MAFSPSFRLVMYSIQLGAYFVQYPEPLSTDSCIFKKYDVFSSELARASLLPVTLHRVWKKKRILKIPPT